MGIRLTLLANLAAISLLGFYNNARADVSATQPFDLSPTTAPSTAPQRYPEIAPTRYPDTVIRTYTTPLPPPPQFGRGDFELTLGGMGFTAFGPDGNDSIGFVTFEGDWFFVDTLSVGLQVGVAPGTFDRHHHHHDDDDRDNNDDDGVRAVEEMVTLRWHFLQAGPLSLFGDMGLGGLHADPDFPSGGRRDNFLAAVGGGLNLRVLPHFYLGAGARAAWIGGGDWDNHNHHRRWSDGVQYYGELSFVFP